MSQKRQITYTIGFKADDTGLKSVRDSLKEISNLGLTQVQLINPKSTQDATNSLKQVKAQAEGVQKALSDSFNQKINTIDIEKFRSSLKSTTGTVGDLASSFNNSTAAGVRGFNELTSQLLTTKTHVKQTSKLLDSMMTTFVNTIKWSISSGILNMFTGTIKSAWSYVQHLDQSLNDIRIVTGKSADEMDRFADKANKAAKALGTQTTEYTKAALIFYQQGLGEEDVQARTDVTIKAANVTGQSTAEVSEQLTAVWNGYKVVAEEAEFYVDKLAAVAASTAADLEELSTGMSKVASAANAMGIDIDQLTAQLSTIVSVTRQDAAVVGTALKTIYSRMGDLKVDGVDEFGTSLGDVSSQLQQMGINVLDQQGNLRDMGIVIEEVAAKWGTWTRAQQQAAAVAIAGKRQYNNLLALFENWDMYESALATSENAEGTLQKQQDIYLDSFEAKLNRLKASTEGLFENLIDEESTKNLIDVLTALVKVIDNIAQGLGGLGNILFMVAGILAKKMSPEIGQGIGRFVENRKGKKFNEAQDQAKANLMTDFGANLPGNEDKYTQGQEKALDLEELRIKNAKILSKEQHEQIDHLIKQTLELDSQNAELEEQQRNLFKIAKNLSDDPINTNVTTAEEVKAIFEKKGTSLFTERGKIENLLGDFEQKTNKDILGKDKAGKDNADKILQESTGKKADGKSDRKNYSKVTREAKKSQQAGINEINKLEKSNSLISDQKFQLEQILGQHKSLIDAIEDEKDMSSLGKKEQEEYKQLLKEINALYDENIKDINKQNDELEETKEKLGQAKQAVDNVEGSIKEMTDTTKIQAVSSTIADAAGNIMLMANAMKLVSNLFTVWQDESLSTKDKITQFITTLASMIGMVVPMILNSVSLIGTKVQDEASKMKRSFGWVGLILEIIAIGVSLTVALVNIFKKDKKTDLEKATEALEAAKKESEAAKEKLNELKEEYKSLMDAISDYKSARTAIDEMRVGTEEWQEAVAALNLQVLDLINKYPQLIKFMKVNENGIYEIEQAGWASVQEELLKEVSAQQATVRFNDLNVTQRQRNVYQEQVKQDLNSTLNEWFGAENKKLDKTIKGGKIATPIFGPIGAITAGVAKKKKEALGANIEDDGSISLYTAQTQLQEDSGLGKIFKELGGVIEGNKISFDELTDISLQNKTEEEIQAIYASIDALNDDSLENEVKSLIKTLDITNKKLEEINQLEELQEKSYLEELALTLGISDAQVYADLVHEQKEATNTSMQVQDYVDKAKFYDNGGKIGDEWVGRYVGTSGDAKAIQSEVSNLLTELYGEGGYTVSGLSAKEIKKGIGKRSNTGQYQFTLNGELVTIDEVINKVAEKRMKENLLDLGVYNESLIKDLESQGFSAKMAYFIGNNYNPDMNWEGANLSQIEQFEKSSFTKFEDEEGNVYNVDQEVYRQNLENYKQKFKEEVEEIFSQSSLAEVYKTGFDEMFKSFTLDDYKNFVTNLTKASFSEGGEEAFNALFESLKDSPELAKKVNEYMSTIDWTDSASINSFRAYLIELGVSIDGINEDWDSFIDNVIDGNKQWISDSQKVINNLATIKEIASDIKVGDIISSEDFKALAEIEPTIANSFLRTADGYLALESGDVLSKKLKNQYQNLNDIEGWFNEIEAAASDYGTGDSNFNIDTFKARTTADQTGFFTDGALNLASALGIDREILIEKINEITALEAAGDTSSSTYFALQDFLANAAKQINQAALDAANDEFNSQNAQEYWITEIAGSWEDIADAVINGKLSDQSQQKATQLWQSKWLTELGFTSDAFLEGFEDTDKLYKDIQAIRKLELNALTEVNAELNKTEILLDKAFGSERVRLLENVVSLQETSTKILMEQTKGVQTAFENLLNNSIYQSYFKNGVLDVQGLINEQAKYDAEDAEYQNIDAILNLYYSTQSAAVDATEAQYELLDAQIESYKAFTESIKEFTDFLSDLNELELSGGRGFERFEESFEKNVDKYLNELNIGFVSIVSQLVDLEELDDSFFTLQDGTAATGVAISTYKDMFSSAVEQYEALNNAAENLHEEFLNIQEEIVEIYDKEIKKLDKINSILSSSADLAKLMGIKSVDYFDSIAQNAERSYDLASQKVTAAQEEYNKALAAGSEEWIETTFENLATATEEQMNSLQTLMDAIADRMEQALTEGINEALGGDLLELTESWELESARDDRWLDEVNKAYALSELERNYRKSIDETDNIAAQKQLNKVMQEQLKMLKEKDRLSQAEIDRANALYELTLKQIALEEAQQTKNKMKLTRDAFGNYTYQYIADQDAIADAEAEVAAAENDLYNLNKDSVKSLSDEYYSTLTEAKDAIAEAARANNWDRVDYLKEYYMDMLKGISAEYNLAVVDFEEILGDLENPLNLKEFLSDEELSKIFNTAIDTAKDKGVEISQEISDLLASESGLPKIIESLEENIKKQTDIDTSIVQMHNLTDNISNELSNNILPKLTNIQDYLVSKGKGIAELIEEAMFGEDSKLTDNTEALKHSTRATLELVSALYETKGVEPSEDLVVLLNQYSNT